MRSRRRPSILLIGSTGQIGFELARTLGPLGDVTVPDRTRLDLSDPRSIGPVVSEAAPDCIVNAAAFTRVDEAESARDLAFRVNADAPGILAEEAARKGALLVHYSTDYVFDGRATVPYPEDAPARPLSVYGESKLAGERAVLDSGARAIVFRTSWVYGRRGRNFLSTILRLARERDRLEVVDDQWGAPTWSRSVAEGTALVLERLYDGKAFGTPSASPAVFHITAAGATTWFRFAEYVLARDPCRTAHRCRRLIPIPSERYPSAATRPRFSALDNARLRETFGIVMPDWRTMAELCLADPTRGSPREGGSRALDSD